MTITRWPLLRTFTMESLPFSRIHYEFITFFANSLCILYPSREFTMDTISVTQIHNEFIIFSGNLGFIIFFAKTLCVLYLLREFIICSLSVPRIHYGIIDFRMTFFRPKNNLFWPFRWPWMTMIFTPLESELNLESNHMHSMCIWPCFRFMTPKWPFSTL